MKTATQFAKECLKEEGYTKELIALVMSTYHVEQFMKDNEMNRLQFATLVLGYARHIQDALSNY